MPRFSHLLSILCALCLGASTLRATNVLSYHYDQQSTGQDLTETVLSPASVTSGTFMRRWVTLTDGYIYAQPLYLENVQITAPRRTGTYNTLFVATEHDSVYAMDARTGKVLWRRSLLTNGLPGVRLITPVPCRDTSDNTDLVPEIGITGTPVMDATNGYLYVAAKSKQFPSKSTRIATPISFSQHGMSSSVNMSKTCGAANRAMSSLSCECRMKSAASALHFSLYPSLVAMIVAVSIGINRNPG